MNTRPHQDDFTRLRRLLALKRHEQPPPGYFDNLHREVIADLRAGAGVQSATDADFLSEAPWIQWVWRVLQGKPILAGAFGVAICSLVISGLYYSESHTAAPVVLLPMPENPAPSYAEKPAGALPLFTGGVASGLTLSSTGGVSRLDAPGSLFDALPKPEAYPISFGVPR
jgi:hypothetical protein